MTVFIGAVGCLLLAVSIKLILSSSGGQNGRQYLGIQSESWVISILSVAGAVLLAGVLRG